VTPLWPLPLHVSLAGHDWLLQILVIALIAGTWLLAAGLIERRTARKGRRADPTPPTGP
jgi:hypothetical protein